jgi:hypothetical protein
VSFINSKVLDNSRRAIIPRTHDGHLLPCQMINRLHDGTVRAFPEKSPQLESGMIELIVRELRKHSPSRRSLREEGKNGARFSKVQKEGSERNQESSLPCSSLPSE